MQCIRFERNEAPAALGGLLLEGDVGCEGELLAQQRQQALGPLQVLARSTQAESIRKL